VQGKVDLYRSILGKFRSKYTGFRQELRRAVESGRQDEAQRLVHSLKGAAGNIGASELHHAASALDESLRASDSHAVQPATVRLVACLEVVLRSLEDLE
jgi:two-component system sensor histidine kinase/response regulator